MPVVSGVPRECLCPFEGLTVGDSAWMSSGAMSMERRSSSSFVGFVCELREGVEVAAALAGTSSVVWDEAAEAVHDRQRLGVDCDTRKHAH